MSHKFTVHNCPLCGRGYQKTVAHWKRFHKDEFSIEKFKSLELGLEKVPECPVCGDPIPYDFGHHRFNQTCGKETCKKVHSSEISRRTMKEIVNPIGQKFQKENGYPNVHKAIEKQKELGWTSLKAGLETRRKKGFPELLDINKRQKEKGYPALYNAMYCRMVKLYGEDSISNCYLLELEDKSGETVIKVGWFHNPNRINSYKKDFKIVDQLVFTGTLKDTWNLEKLVVNNESFKHRGDSLEFFEVSEKSKIIKFMKEEVSKWPLEN